jgi:hypothetical protein
MKDCGFAANTYQELIDRETNPYEKSVRHTGAGSGAGRSLSRFGSDLPPRRPIRPSGSYAGSRYYENYKRVPVTGDGRTDLVAIALSQLGYQEGNANGNLYLEFDRLRAIMLGEKITATIWDGDTQVGRTIEYSVYTYVQRNQNTTNVAMRELLEAIYNYGESAKNA